MNIRGFSKDVKTEAFLNILQLCVSQVREHPDTLESHDQFVAANELWNPEPCNRENKGTPVRAQMSLSQHFPEISNGNGCLWKPLLVMTILAPIWQQSNYFSDPVMGEFSLNSQFTYASLNVNFQPQYISGVEIVPNPQSWRQPVTETDFEATQRISEE